MAVIGRRRGTPAHPDTLALLRRSRGAALKFNLEGTEAAHTWGKNASGAVNRLPNRKSS